MKECKTIIIVDNDPARIAAAEVFFSTITDVIFIWASDRKSAQEFLPKADGIIIQLNIPYEDNESLSDYPGYFESDNKLGKEDDKNKVHTRAMQINAYSLLIEAKIKNIPHLLVCKLDSRVGSLTLFKNKELPRKNLIALVATDNRSKWKEFDHEKYIYLPILDTDWEVSSALDRNTDPWQIIWGRLSEQF